MLLRVTVNDLLHFAPLLGLVQGLLLAGILWLNNRIERSKNIYLVLHLLTTSLIMAIPLVQDFIGYPASWMLDALVLVVNQGLYLYILSFQQPIRLPQLVKHYGILFFAFPFSYWCYHKWATYKLINGQLEIQHSVSYTVLSFMKLGFLVGYSYASIQLLIKHRKLSREQYSETSAVNLKWVNKLIYLSFIISGLVAVFYAMSALVPGLSIRVTNLFSYLCVTVYLYFAFLKGNVQKPILPLAKTDGLRAEKVVAAPEKTVAIEPDKPKYQRSTLSLETSESILEKIEATMQSHRLFLEPELTLPLLAEKVNAPTHHVSQVLNEQLQKNFYDYVNGYRVEVAKQMLLDPTKKHYTILAIAFDSGFNSKTTFNKVFKRFTGQTPTEYVVRKMEQEMAQI